MLKRGTRELQRISIDQPGCGHTRDGMKIRYSAEISILISSPSITMIANRLLYEVFVHR